MVITSTDLGVDLEKHPRRVRIGNATVQKGQNKAPEFKKTRASPFHGCTWERVGVWRASARCKVQTTPMVPRSLVTSLHYDERKL